MHGHAGFTEDCVQISSWAQYLSSPSVQVKWLFGVLPPGLSQVQVTGPPFELRLTVNIRLPELELLNWAPPVANFMEMPSVPPWTFSPLTLNGYPSVIGTFWPHAFAPPSVGQAQAGWSAHCILSHAWQLVVVLQVGALVSPGLQYGRSASAIILKAF